MTGAQKGLALLVVVFLGFYMFTDPTGLAELARDVLPRVGELIAQMFGAVIEFIQAVLS